jgi:hypothetical protein
MRRKPFLQRRRRLALLVIAAGALSLALTTGALAVFPDSNVGSYAACLNTSGAAAGTFSQVKPGDVPAKACGSNQMLVHLSGGDITAVRTPPGSGLTGGTDNGAATLSLAGGQVLPQTCAGGQVPKWNGTSWTCGDDIDTDTNTTYSAGQGLDLDGEDGTTFNILPQYALPQGCGSGQVAKFNSNFGGFWSCQNDATGQAVLPAYHLLGIDDDVGFDGREIKTIASLSLPAGKWAVHANLELVNQDYDFQPFGCRLAGATFNGGHLDQGRFNGLEDHETRPLLLGTSVTLAAPTVVYVECNGFKLSVAGYFDALAVQ